MGKRERVVLSWSGGKDSTLALYELLQGDRYEVVSLLTTVARQYERISHHGVRTALLEQQAAALGMKLHKLYLPSHATSNEDYEARMKQVMLEYKRAGVRTVSFGDIFLQDLREYRERNLARVGMKALFPIWHRNTKELIRAFIDLGFRAFLSCVDGKKLEANFAGRAIDAEFVRDLPALVDPCGENGEFHTCV